MPEQLTTQERLFGPREQDYGVFSLPNRVLYPFIKAAQVMADEAKVEYTGDSLYIRAVDAANVGLVDITLPVDHDGDPFMVGMNLKRLASRLQNKPRGSDSVEVRLDLAYPSSTLTVDREWANDRVWNVQERFGTLDPDSIRERPDVPDVETDATARLDREAFGSYLNTLPDDSKPVELTVEDGELRLGQIGSDDYEYRSLATVDGVGEGAGESLYSLEYLSDMVHGLSVLGVDTVELRWADEFPLFIEYETDHIEGQYVLAPRVMA